MISNHNVAFGGDNQNKIWSGNWKISRKLYHNYKHIFRRFPWDIATVSHDWDKDIIPCSLMLLAGLFQYLSPLVPKLSDHVIENTLQASHMIC